MKAIKWIIGIVVGVLVLVIALLLIVPQFIDIQKYKPEIEKQAEQATGRPFSIGGDLRLSLFPWAVIGLSAQIVIDAQHHAPSLAWLVFGGGPPDTPRGGNLPNAS